MLGIVPYLRLIQHRADGGMTQCDHPGIVVAYAIYSPGAQAENDPEKTLIGVDAG